MSKQDDLVVVSKSKIEAAIESVSASLGWGAVLAVKLRVLLDQATPVSGEVVGKIVYDRKIDEHGNVYHKSRPQLIETVSEEKLLSYEQDTKLYTTPQPAPDTVPVDRFNKLVDALEKANKAIRYAKDNVSIADGKRAYFENYAYYSEVEKALEEALKGE